MSISQITPHQLRPSDDDGFGRIVRVGPERLNEAIGRLLAAGGPPDREHVRQFLKYAADHQINLNGLWARLDAQGYVNATALAIPSPGRTAMVFCSHPTSGGQVRSYAGLVRYACDDLRQHDVQLAQVLLDPTELLARDVFKGAGFLDLAVLSYLERPIGPRAVPSSQVQWPQALTVTTYAKSSREEFVDVLDRTYEATLDCPGLRGHRQTSDILDGHRATGLFDPDLWLLLRHEDQNVGTLLLNPSSDRQSIELVYLGLIPSARRLGWGSLLLRYGIQRVSQRSERMMNLAVDESNSPAVSLYIREGFRHVMRRRAMICPLKDGAM